jgi:hypothetical protein
VVYSTRRIQFSFLPWRMKLGLIKMLKDCLPLDRGVRRWDRMEFVYDDKDGILES